MLLEDKEDERVASFGSSSELKISKDIPMAHSKLVKEIENMLKNLMIDYNESNII